MEGDEGEGDELWGDVGGKERALKVVDREQTREVLHLAPVASGDNLELIEKWKALIDTKDRILKQKNAQIERHVCMHKHVWSIVHVILQAAVARLWLYECQVNYISSSVMVGNVLCFSHRE